MKRKNEKMSFGKNLKKRILQAAGLLALLLLLPSAGVITARADTSGDYRIGNPDWDDQTAAEGKLYGTWDMAEDTTGYTVTLYKGTAKVGSKRVGGGGRFDFSTFLNSKKGGTGNYQFTVYPTRGGEELKITSETFEVTTAMITAIKTRIQKERKEAIAATGGGWVRGPGYIWIYYDSQGNQLKSTWVDWKDHRYYLDKNGIMVTGWQAVDKVYYYFERKGTVDLPLGALWTNATTPDGYRVDESGARIDEKGNVVKPPTYKTLSTVSVSLKESQEPGKYTQITGVSCGNGTVSNLEYSSDPTTWTTDTTGKISFTVTLSDDYFLKQGFKVVCARSQGVTVLNHSGTTFACELYYKPKYVLAAPGDFYISGGTTLRWGKVAHADEYTVKITVTEEETEDGETTAKSSTRTVTTADCFVDLDSQDIYDAEQVKSITVTATAKNTKLYVSSKASGINDLPALIAERSVPGTFDSNAVGLYYYDENGERATGWKELLGGWYYFRPTGYAQIGWYRDTATDCWYYFDESCRMVTGTVTLPDGVTYTFNDGTRTDLPLGAWIQ